MNGFKSPSPDHHDQIAQQLVKAHGPWDAYKIGIALLKQSTQMIQNGLKPHPHTSTKQDYIVKSLKFPR